METTLLTVSKIFSERIFRIPDYQRGYAWTERQLKDFWSDLELLEISKNHYVGVLTLEAAKREFYGKWNDDLWIIESKNYEPFYIVDGQQRLTTTILLIQAIIESVGEDNELNYTKVSDIRKRFIFENKQQGISRSYIFGYEKDNPSYEFLKTKIFNESSEENYINQETVYTSNLESAKSYFIDKLKDKELHEIETIYRKLTQNFLFNIYTISDDIDVFVTFETMNNRGKPLSLLELLKNRLIYLTTKFYTETYDKEYLRKKINECWKTVYHNLGKNKSNPLEDDKFLYNHLMFYFGTDIIGKDDKKDIRFIHRSFRFRRWKFNDFLLEEKFTSKRINQTKKNTVKSSLTIEYIEKYVNSLQCFVEIWYNINNPFQSNYTLAEKKLLDKINHLGLDEFASLLLVFFDVVKDESNRVKILNCIEKILFMTTMSYRYSSNFDPDKYLILAIDLFNKETTHEKIILELEKDVYQVYTSQENIERIKKDFRKDGFYDWEGIRYFLYEYEENLQNQSKSNQKKLDWEDIDIDRDDFISVEHIFPQTAKKEDWNSFFVNYTPRQRNILKNSLGNLLPLSKPKNSSLQNKPFKDKIGNENNSVGYRYGCYSENEITIYEDWTPKEILERGVKLLTYMSKRWQINFGDRNNMIEVLGLEFLQLNNESVNTTIK